MTRLKKILKWTGIALGCLVAIGLVANAWFVWTTDTRLEQQLAEIRAAGDPVTLADLARPPIPPEKNADTYLRRAEAGVKAMEDEVYRNRDWYKKWQHGPLPLEGQKVVKAALGRHTEVVPLLEQAAACSDYDAGLDYTVAPKQFMTQLLEVVQNLRGGARMLRLRAYLLVAEGKRDEAVRTGITLFRLGRLFDRNPSITSYLIALTVRGIASNCTNFALQSGAVSQAVRDDLDAELAIQERMEGLVQALESERAHLLQQFIDNIPARNFWLIHRGYWNMQELACLDIYPTFLALAVDSGSYREVDQTIESQKSALATLLFPAIKATYLTTVRTRAEIRCLRVLNALQIHTIQGSNEIPKLSELGLPTETTTDPFTGEPLKVKKTPRGWLVYSVGKNFTDDGGKVDDHDIDVGVGPPPEAKADEK